MNSKYFLKNLGIAELAVLGYQLKKFESNGKVGYLDPIVENRRRESEKFAHRFLANFSPKMDEDPKDE